MCSWVLKLGLQLMVLFGKVMGLIGGGGSLSLLWTLGVYILGLFPVFPCSLRAGLTKEVIRTGTLSGRRTSLLQTLGVTVWFTSAFPCSRRAGLINHTVTVPFLPWWSGTSGGANWKKTFLLSATFLRVCYHRNRKKLIQHSLTYVYMHIQRNNKKRKCWKGLASFTPFQFSWVLLFQL